MKIICKLSLAGCMVLVGASTQAVAQTAPSPQELTLFGSLRLREEQWGWFGTGTGKGNYNFFASQLRLGFTHKSPKDEVTVEIEQPTLLGLPSSSTLGAPQGQLGMGASYHDASGNQKTSIFLKQAFWKGKQPGNPASNLKIGRFEVIDGSETTTNDPTLGWLKRERINHRLIGNFGFTHVGRSFDAVQLTNASPSQTTSFMFGRPTRGVFDIKGMDELEHVGLGYGTLVMPMGSKTSPAELRLFGIHYEDTRSGVVKSDNRPAVVRTADKAAIRIETVGGNYLRTFPAGSSKADVLAWGAWQTGKWGVQNHDAYAYDFEAGFQPKGMAWKPWIRFGYYEASGDGNSADGTHGTFFPILPTPRIYARFPFYSETNLKDAFASLILKPTPKLTSRIEYHKLALAKSSDLWYAGGGAFEDTGNFGYAGRPSGGFGSLATLIDVGLDYQLKANTTVSLYFGFANGGNVVQSIYPGKNATLAFVEFLHKW